MEVGIDVEIIDPTIDLNIAKNYFYNSEYKNIKKSKDPKDEFFKYWVLKESYMKYTGFGFNLNLNSFEIIIEDEIRLKNDDTIKFSLFEIKDYKLGIASKYNVTSIKKNMILMNYLIQSIKVNIKQFIINFSENDGHLEVFQHNQKFYPYNFSYVQI